MTTRARLQNANDSKSLWNYTLSPGFSEFDAHILRLAVMRYGCGAWREINKHFPLKTCGQLNLQTQRLFGQQALAEFNKVHIDPLKIKEKNDKIEGFRKNTCLINEGNNLTAEEKATRREKHIETHGLPQELYEQIQVPVVLDPPTPCKTVLDDIEKLREMYRAVYDIQLRIKHLRMNDGKNSANIAVKAKQEKLKKKKEQQQQQKNNSNNKDNMDMDEVRNEDEEKADVEIIDNETAKDKETEAVPPAEPKEVEPVAAAPAFGGDVDMMDMDEETAMALALSASMASTNINTPAVEKKNKSKKGKKSSKKKTAKKSAKKSTKKSGKKSSKKSRKRKNMDPDGDEEYVPGGAQPKKKRSRKK